MVEIWRAAAGFPGYEVSSFGRMRSLARQVVEHNGKVRFHKAKPLKASPNPGDGYPRVSLRRDGKTRYTYVHVLVALTFIGPPPPGHEVRHGDGNRANPRLDNLCYGTRADNIDDARRHGTFPHAGNWVKGQNSKGRKPWPRSAAVP
jgi:hypothetical protein